MAPFTSSSRGLIADLHPPRSERCNRRKGRAAVAISALGLAFLVASLLHSVSSNASEASTESPTPSPANDSYVFKVYSLNHTSTNAVGSGTAFFFDMVQLPVNFSLMQFGDYTTDARYDSIYFAGSGILLNSSGTNAWITLREGDGKLVSSVFYHGQPIVVFTGQTTTYANCDRPAVFDGTDMMVQDWRKANWTPNDGIIIGHPKNVTISGATFYLAVYQPGVSAQMPEFDLLLPVVGFVAIALVLIRRRGKSSRDE